MNTLSYADRRCLCGNLLCRVHGVGAELKCRRCKRLVLISHAGVPLTNTLQSEAARQPRPCPLITGSGNVHCLCGSLLSKKTDLHLELKCRRCKRSITLAFDTIHQRPEVLHPESEPAAVGAG